MVIKGHKENVQKSICAVVVTYNRRELLLNCLNALKNQTYAVDHIVVINNASTDGTVEYLQQHNWINNSKFHLLTLENNLGGAGGFYYGIKYAYKQGFDYIWLMDDDGEPELNCLKELIPFTSENNYIGPLVLDTEDKETLAFAVRPKPKAKKVFSKTELNNVAQKIVLDDVIMPFNGTLFSCQLVEKIGFPRKEYFIWGDETEYTNRARKNGYSVFTIPKAEFFHPRQKQNNIPMLGGRFTFSDPNSLLKLYCICRNDIVNLREYRGVHFSLAFVCKVVWFYLFTRPNLKKLGIACQAMWHGFKKDFSYHNNYMI